MTTLRVLADWLSPQARRRVCNAAHSRGVRLDLEMLERREVLSAVAWSAGPNLPTARTDVTAFLGPDGDVAIVGGATTTVSQLPSTATAWSAGQAIDAALKSPGAVTKSSGGVYVYGGLKGSSPSEEGWAYDYYGGDNQNIADLDTPRANFGATIDELDRAYAIGGLDDNNGVIASVDRYNAVADQWDAVAPLPAARQNAATTIDNDGHIYVFGGQTGTGTSGVESTSYRYDVATNVWSAMAPMPTGTIDSAAVFAPNGDIYVLGGRTAAGAIATVQVYDPETNTWSNDTPLPAAVYNHGAVVDSLGRITVVGGTSAAGAAVATVTRSQRLDIPETPPLFTSNPIITGSLDAPYAYDVNATANPEATFSLVTAPAGMEIDAATGLISWQPIEVQTGMQPVTVRAENRVGFVDQAFSINVLGDTTPPTTPTNLAITAANTNSVSLSWGASTDNHGAVTYEVLEGLRSGWRGRNTTYRVITAGVTITGTTATITGLAPLSSHKYSVQAVDAAGNKSLRSNVVVAATQSAPVLRYYANGMINSAVTVKANFPLSIQLTATANPTATFALLDGPATMTLNPTTGLLAWTPTAADVGTRSVVVAATNSVGTAQLTIPITIAPDLPVLSLNYNLNGGGPHATAGMPFQLQALDASHTPSTFELIAGPAGMTIDANTGLAAWAPTTDDAGPTTVTIRATNSAGSTDATTTFETYFTAGPTNLQVTNLNALHPTASWTPPVGEGAADVAGYTVLATVRYRIGRFMKTHSVRLDAPATANSIEIPGLLTGKSYTLYVTAYNADGEHSPTVASPTTFVAAPALPVISWTVTNPSSGGPLVAGQPINIQLTNGHTDPATYSVVSAPAGLTIDPQSGLATWTPSAADIGPQTVTLRATNSVGPRDVVVSLNVLFSGAVGNASAIVNNGVANVAWTAPADNVVPIASYQVTMQWSSNGRSRTRTVTVPASLLSTSLALVPTGAVWHQGVYITPIDELGRLGAATPLVPYLT